MKKIITLLAALFLTNVNAVETKNFSLSEASFVCVTKLISQSADPKKMCDYLQAIINDPSTPIDLVPAVRDVINNNIAWTLIRKLGMEEQKNNLMAQEPNGNPDKSLKKLYDAEFERRLKRLSPDEIESISVNAQIEACTALKSFFGSIDPFENMALIKPNDSNREHVKNLAFRQSFPNG